MIAELDEAKREELKVKPWMMKGAVMGIG